MGHRKGTPKRDKDFVCGGGGCLFLRGGFHFAFRFSLFFFLFFFFLEDNGVHVFAQITVIKEVSSSAS